MSTESDADQLTSALAAHAAAADVVLVPAPRLVVFAEQLLLASGAAPAVAADVAAWAPEFG